MTIEQKQLEDEFILLDEDEKEYGTSMLLTESNDEDEDDEDDEEDEELEEAKDCDDEDDEDMEDEEDELDEAEEDKFVVYSAMDKMFYDGKAFKAKSVADAKVYDDFKKADADAPAKAGVKVRKVSDIKEGVEVDFSEDVSALMEGETGLSEAFKEKASLIFETAFNQKVDEIRSQLQEEKEKQVEEEVNEQMDATIDVMSESIDKYLSHIAEEWMKENRLSVETALRTEIAENFISGLKTLFTEHYIDVPEEKVDLVEEMSNRIDALKDKLNDSYSKNLELSEQIREFRKIQIIDEMKEGLTLSESEKLAELVSDIEFINEESFVEKVETLKKAYFGKKTRKPIDEDVQHDQYLGVNIDETVDGDLQPVKGHTKMDKYVETLTAAMPSRFLNTRIKNSM